MHQPLLILDQNLHLQLQSRVCFATLLLFLHGTSWFNISHDRLAYNQGPCYRPTAAAQSGRQILWANSPQSAGTVTYARNASPDLSSRTYVYVHPPCKLPSAYIWYMVYGASPLPALAPTAPSCHTLCGHEMIYAAKQLGETNNAPRRHWILDGGVRQFHGL